MGCWVTIAQDISKWGMCVVDGQCLHDSWYNVDVNVIGKYLASKGLVLQAWNIPAHAENNEVLSSGELDLHAEAQSLEKQLLNFNLQDVSSITDEDSEAVAALR